MKKNLLSIIILAFLVVNIVLTSIMMFSVTSASKKTAKLIDDIASVLHLEISTEPVGEDMEGVSIDNTDVYVIEDKMTILLKPSEDGKDHYFICDVSLAMDKKNKDYKNYSADLVDKESLIKSEITEVIASYSVEEARVDQDGMKKEIVKRIQNLFDSQFIYKVAFSGVLIQ